MIQNKSKQSAGKLQKAMKGLGTDEQGLVRVMVTCEEEMDEVKDAFNAEYKGTLEDWIKVSQRKIHKKILNINCVGLCL